LLTAAALAALHWFQKRASTVTTRAEQSFALMIIRPALYNGSIQELGFQKTDYDAVLQ